MDDNINIYDFKTEIDLQGLQTYKEKNNKGNLMGVGQCPTKTHLCVVVQLLPF